MAINLDWQALANRMFSLEESNRPASMPMWHEMYDDDNYYPPNYNGWVTKPYDVFKDQSINLDLRRKPWYEEQWHEDLAAYKPLTRVNWDSQLFTG